MAKKQLLEDIKIRPSNFYRTPSDVARDRRFSDVEKLEILEAWERDIRARADDEGTTGGVASQIETVAAARREIKERMPGKAEERKSSKIGGGPVQ